jgi:hypothetical protein
MHLKQPKNFFLDECKFNTNVYIIITFANLRFNNIRTQLFSFILFWGGNPQNISRSLHGLANHSFAIMTLGWINETPSLLHVRRFCHILNIAFGFWTYVYNLIANCLISVIPWRVEITLNTERNEPSSRHFTWTWFGAWRRKTKAMSLVPLLRHRSAMICWTS